MKRVDGSKINKLKETITDIRNGDRDAEHKTFANSSAYRCLQNLSPILCRGYLRII